MAGGAWVTIVEIGVFLVSTWMMGRGFRAVGLSPIIGEILAGVVLGPHVLNVVPYAEPGNSGSLPTIFVLMGQVRGWGSGASVSASLCLMCEAALRVGGAHASHAAPRARSGPSYACHSP